MSRLRLLFAALAAVLLAAAYANHFDNGFHFDDSHAIVDNAFLRDVRHIPRYFRDATTFSVLPLNRSYRPVLQTTLAIDYRIAGGYRPRTFQITSFLWFVVQLLVMYALAVTLADRTLPNSAANRAFALLATTIYALHPVCAETVNYVIQRGEILSTVGVLGTIVLYARAPSWRRFGVYLAPLVFGALAKPPALIAPALLAVYVWLFETNGTPGGRTAARWSATLKAILPCVVTTVALAIWIASRTPATYITGAASPLRYWLSQPFVTLRYVLLVLAPIDLSADNDWPLVTGVSDPRVWYGIVFLAGVVWLAVRTARRDETRPAAFGLWWFLLTLLPTAATPLAEVANDHRLFFPLVGLMIAGTWPLYLWWSKPATTPRARTIAAVFTVAVLLASAAGVHARNEVWRTDETLWYDVTVKSPTNGRGLMNYGLTRMEKGDYATAIAYFQRALAFTPNYPLLHTNLGIAYGGVGRTADAEREFQVAMQLAPSDWRSHYYYGRWLRQVGRRTEAIARLQVATSLNPADLLSQEELKRATTEPENGPEELLARSLAAYQAGRFRDCIAFAQRALTRRPDYAEAYNNIAAGHNALGEWDAGIAAAERALQLKPDFPLARGNLAHARTEKARAEKR